RPLDEAMIASLVEIRRPLLVEDADELGEGGAKALAATLGARSLVAVPFSQKDKARHGVLLVCDAKPRDWGGKAFALLEDLAQGALARWALLEEVAARKQREEELLLL